MHPRDSAAQRACAVPAGAHAPATTLVEVAALLDPAMLVEVEADAIHPDARDWRPRAQPDA